MHNNPFNLPPVANQVRVLDLASTSMGRLDSMTSQLSKQSIEMMLCTTQANLELLYIKAKNFHWNVKGVGFQGVHEMFDQIQDFASDQADRIAERMRYRDFTVNATAQAYLNCAWFPEGNSNLSQTGMLNDMCMTLTCIMDHLCDFICNMDEYPVDQNMLQDISETLGKYCYFVKSNMPVEERTEAY